MRVFNVRLAAILLGIAVILGIGVYALNKYQIYRNASFFLVESQNAEQRAAEAAKEKKTALQEESLKDAIKYLNWYVGLMPTKYESMEHLGILLADKAQWGGTFNRQTFLMAYNMLEKTVRLDPERRAARRRLVAMGMLSGRFPDAKDHLERFLLVDSPKDPDLLEQLAQCQVGLRTFDKAQESLTKAIASNPAQVTAYGKLAELLRFRLSKPKEADQWMAKLVKANSKSSKAHYLRAVYLARLHLDDEALEEACKAKELAPNDADVLLLVAECNMAKKKYDNARDCLAQGIKLQSSSVPMHRAMFQVELRAGNHDKAVAALQEGIKATDRNPELLWLMANLLVDSNKLDEARRILDDLRKKTFPKPKIDFVDARVEYVQGHWKNALERLNDVRGSLISEPQYVMQIDLSLARCYHEVGDRDQEEQALRRVLAVDPSYPPARKALAELSRRKGDMSVTLSEYLDLYKRGQLGGADKLRLAQLLFAATVGQKPEQRNWKAVEKVLDAAEKAIPNSPDVPVLRSSLLAAQGKVADAEKLLLKARDKYPKELAPWKGLVAMAVRDKDWGKMEELLTGSQKALGDTVELRLFRAQCALIRGGVDVATHLQELDENSEQFPEEERLRLWSGLLGAALQVGDRKQAGALAQKIAEKQPNNVQIRYFQLEQAIAAEDIAATKQALKEIEVVVGQDSYWLYGQALLLYLQAKNNKDGRPLLEKALDYLKKARELRKDWSRIPMVEAGIYDQQRKVDLALQSYLEGIDMGDRNLAGIQRVIQIYFQSKRYADARRLLSRLETAKGAFPTRLMQAAAECDMYLKNTTLAIEETRKAVPSDSKNGRDQVWLGQMLGVFGRQAKNQGESANAVALLGEAEEALRQAVKLEPKLPVARQALVQFLALADEQDKAQAAIQAAKADVSAKDLSQLLAECYEMVHDIDAAQKQYEDMLQAAPQDIAVARLVVDFYHRTGKLKPAEALLQGILDGKMQAGDSDVAWARRELATFFILSGKYPDLQKARKLVEQNLSSPQASIADRRLLATLMATDPRRAERDQAIEMFESLGASATPDDRFILARLYVKAENWIKAGDLLRGLVATNDKELRYLEFYIDELLKHNELSSTRTYLDRLERLAPNSFGTVSRKADLLFATNQRPQAFEVLKDFVDNVDAEIRDRGLRLRMVAEKLTELAAQLTKPEQASLAAQGIDLAESLLRTFVRENPGQELVLAVFLGQHGKIDEALGILDENLQIGDVEQFTEACLLILQNGKATREQMQRMNKIMQSAETKFERVPSLLLALAYLRTRQTLDSEAADIYREILKKAPDEARAMNNLAVVQAMQGVKLDESLALVNRAMEIAGPLGAMLDSRATVYLAMNNPQKAIEDMKDAIADKDKEAPEWLFHRAQAYALAGDNAKAKKDLNAALKKGLTEDSLQPLEVPAFEKLRQALR